MWVALAVVAAEFSPPVRQLDVVPLVVIAVMAVVSVRVQGLTASRAGASFLLVVLLASVPLLGPLTAGVLGLLWAVADRKYGMSIVPVFNGAMSGVTALLGGLAYVAAGGLVPILADLSPGSLLMRVGLPLVAADLVMTCANAAILTGMIAISGGAPRAVLMGAIRELLPLYLAYAVIAFVFVVLWVPADAGPVAVVLIAVPLAIARFVYTLYGDEMRAHARILSLFARAGDGPEGSLAAHTARVDRLCQGIAATLGLSETDRRLLEHAAALHDVGMKGVLRETDQERTGRASATNIRALLPHPALAAEVMQGVSFLEDAAATVRSHHERMDGRGYPDGLVGEEIPLTARVLAVADAFDALTTTRGEVSALSVQDALDELATAVDDGQLDSRVVAALRDHIGQAHWEPWSDPVSEGSWLWEHHSLPTMSEVIADEVVDADRAGR